MKELNKEFIQSITTACTNYASSRKFDPKSTITGNMAIVNAAVDFETGAHHILKRQDDIEPETVLVMRNTLLEAQFQFEYMRKKFLKVGFQTGSVDSVLFNINVLLNKIV